MPVCLLIHSTFPPQEKILFITISPPISIKKQSTSRSFAFHSDVLWRWALYHGHMLKATAGERPQAPLTLLQSEVREGRGLLPSLKAWVPAPQFSSAKVQPVQTQAYLNARHKPAQSTGSPVDTAEADFSQKVDLPTREQSYFSLVQCDKDLLSTYYVNIILDKVYRHEMSKEYGGVYPWMHK